jgi:branched-chain amino acid transport system permease protein
MFVAGVLLYRLLLQKIIPGGELNTRLYTAGLSLLVANLALFAWTGDYRTISLSYGATPVRPFGIAIAVPLAVAFVLALLLTLALAAFLSRTDLGRAVRATSQNAEASLLMGIDTERVAMLTFGLGTALAGAAGILLAPSLYLYPTVGELLIVKCFVVVVLGGLGSVPGAIAGGILLGVTESLGAVYVSGTYKDGIGFVLFLAVLLYKPSGLFGAGR